MKLLALLMMAWMQAQSQSSKSPWQEEMPEFPARAIQSCCDTEKPKFVIYPEGHESATNSCILIYDSGHFQQVPCAQTGTTGAATGAALIKRDQKATPHKCHHVDPEPMDVPATIDKNAFYACSDIAPDDKNGNVLRCPPHPGTYTCEKGSGRILLEDVDNNWHCIKFPKAETSWQDLLDRMPKGVIPQ